ncbi:MAG: Holliday junction resolvase [Candidatus Thermoplasmatota archaeon]|nr:Holliday junction resolvase [Candidatus Thermoplasmatota archaeon]
MSIYERELKGILQYDEEVLDSATKAYPENIKRAFYKIKKRPFIVLRAAGSFGIDLVAIRKDCSFPIEVKAWKEKKFWFSNTPRLKEQVDWLKKLCIKAGIVPIYAFRLKNVRAQDPWRIFTFELPSVKGSELYNKIPKLRETEEGNYVMDWEEGLELHKFIEILCEG